MQAADPALQHEVMIEAVENCWAPQVTVIDEIGRELEATAARTIAERAQLRGRRTGNSLENLLNGTRRRRTWWAGSRGDAER